MLSASVRSFVRPFVRSSIRPSVRPSVCSSVCLNPKFGQLFDLSWLNLRGSAERTCNKRTTFCPTFYVFYYSRRTSSLNSTHFFSSKIQVFINFLVYLFDTTRPRGRAGGRTGQAGRGRGPAGLGGVKHFQKGIFKESHLWSLFPHITCYIEDIQVNSSTPVSFIAFNSSYLLFENGKWISSQQQ